MDDFAVGLGGDGGDGRGHAEVPAVVGVAAAVLLEGIVGADDFVIGLESAGMRAIIRMNDFVKRKCSLDLAPGGRGLDAEDGVVVVGGGDDEDKLGLELEGVFDGRLGVAHSAHDEVGEVVEEVAGEAGRDHSGGVPACGAVVGAGVRAENAEEDGLAELEEEGDVALENGGVDNAIEVVEVDCHVGHGDAGLECGVEDDVRLVGPAVDAVDNAREVVVLEADAGRVGRELGDVL